MHESQECIIQGRLEKTDLLPLLVPSNQHGENQRYLQPTSILRFPGLSPLSEYCSMEKVLELVVAWHQIPSFTQ
jgi:hypothetical protein